MLRVQFCSTRNCTLDEYKEEMQGTVNKGYRKGCGVNLDVFTASDSYVDGERLLVMKRQ